MPDSLKTLRQQIDALDAQLLELFNHRATLALQVAESKTAAGEVGCFYRPEREAQVLRRVREMNRGPIPADSVARLFRELMSACLALEKPLAVAFLGPEGTFSQQATYKHFGHAIRAVPQVAIDEIFRAVECGDCQFGVVPVENSTEGVIAHTLDCFVNSPLLICGEVALRIRHNLLSRETDLARVREVFSHQQSLAQCRRWLDRHLPGVARTAVASNAEGAHLAAETSGSAAIAGDMAAELYDLNVLARHVEDEADNTTRFLVVGRQAAGPSGQDKTSLLISADNKPGALYRILAPFAAHGISLSKIESRPSHQGIWEYVFFIDVEGHRDDPRLATALQELEQQVRLLKILGSYPRATA